MAGPRAEKVAVVDEVKDRFDAAEAVLVTEYRGLTVGQLAALRSSLREVGGQYKIYKNSLVRRAVADLDADLDPLLTGPTALTFVTASEDRPADPSAVAKALKEFGKDNPLLVVKGGLLGDSLLDVDEAVALADLPSREELLSKFAGLLQAPLTKSARLIAALPQKMAYGLAALIEEGGPGDGAAPVADAPEAAAPDPVPETASSDDPPAVDEVVSDSTDSPSDETATEED